MSALFIILLSTLAFASTPPQWSGVLEIGEKHEFYQEGKAFEAPANSWQTLFSVSYVTRDLKKFKDCVFYRIPGVEAGKLKLKTTLPEVSCEKFILEPGDREIEGVKSLEYVSVKNGLNLTFSLPKYKLELWEIRLPVSGSKEPRSLMSSAEFKSPKVLLLAPPSQVKEQSKPVFAQGICHKIDDNCQEISLSTCSECEEGWYEIPNGCPQGPKHCGRDRCGEKNQPACRRGMEYQRTPKKYECRIDPSFAYCKPGLVIQCEGALAYCR